MDFPSVWFFFGKIYGRGAGGICMGWGGCGDLALRSWVSHIADYETRHLRVLRSHIPHQRAHEREYEYLRWHLYCDNSWVSLRVDDCVVLDEMGYEKKARLFDQSCSYMMLEIWRTLYQTFSLFWFPSFFYETRECKWSMHAVADHANVTGLSGVSYGSLFLFILWLDTDSILIYIITSWWDDAFGIPISWSV